MIELSYGMIALITFGLILFLILTRMPIAMVFFAVGLIGFAFMLPRSMLIQIGPSMWRMLNSFPLTSVVPFVLMGELMLMGGISQDLYNALEKWINRLPGGLAQVNIASCALFAAISGSSVSTAATMGVIAGPEMERRGYDNRLTYGTLAAGGTLGILIPPSIPMIIYGSLTSTSIGQLFMAGVIPGIVLALFFMIISAVWAWKYPNIAPRSDEKISLKEKIIALRGVFPVAVIILAIIGGIYGGVVTPTESATIALAIAFLFTFLKKKLTWKVLKKSLLSTIAVSSMSYMILAGSALINFMFNYAKVPALLSQYVATISADPITVLVMVCIMYIILGMFIDGISMVVLTVGAIVPLLKSVGFDPVWIGIVLVVLVELALITPPVGINLYVLQGVSQRASFSQIAAGAIPYMFVMVFMVVVLTVFPQLALWLPSTMK